MNRLIIFLSSGFFLLTLLTVIGCEGRIGPRGEKGSDGPTGPPYEVQPPNNRFFSVAVGNSDAAHNGAPKIYLVFDSLNMIETDAPIVYCQQLSIGSKAPDIDGIDEGETEWGKLFTQVPVFRGNGFNNFIESTTIRAAYDDKFIYFQVKWAEVDNEEYGYEIAETNTPAAWHYSGPPNPPGWTLQPENSDFLSLMFEATSLTYWNSYGCTYTCHGGASEVVYHATNFSRERLDAWVWRSGYRNEIGYADDIYIDNTPIIGVKGDVGLPATLQNFSSRRVGDDLIEEPKYQHINDPNAYASPPLWNWQIVPFDVINPDWEDGATIPGFIASTPTLSRADVIAKGTFDNGSWTVEFRRRRINGNGDDAQF